MARPAHRYSIAEARDNLPRLVRAAEQGTPVEIDRRGTPAAFLVSPAEFRRLHPEPKESFWDAYQRWRKSVDPKDLEGPDFLEGVRDRSPGRDFKW